MASPGRNFFRSIIIYPNKPRPVRFLVVAHGSFLAKESEAIRFEKANQFAEFHCIVLLDQRSIIQLRLGGLHLRSVGASHPAAFFMQIGPAVCSYPTRHPVPPVRSSSVTPSAVSRWRIWSAWAKFLFLRASARRSMSNCISPPTS